MPSVYDLSWNKDSFFSKLMLFFRSRAEEWPKIHSSDTFERAEGYANLSSTYYAIASTARTKLKKACRAGVFAVILLPVWALTWAPLGWWCYTRMLPLSNKAVRAVGYENMKASWLDVRQSVLRKHKLHFEAEYCIDEALRQQSTFTTRTLLLVGMVRVHIAQNKRTSATVTLRRVCDRASFVAEEDPRQAIRVYRHIAELLEELDMEGAHSYRERAREIACELNVKDQLVKIG